MPFTTEPYRFALSSEMPVPVVFVSVSMVLLSITNNFHNVYDNRRRQQPLVMRATCAIPNGRALTSRAAKSHQHEDTPFWASGIMTGRKKASHVCSVFREARGRRAPTSNSSVPTVSRVAARLQAKVVTLCVRSMLADWPRAQARQDSQTRPDGISGGVLRARRGSNEWRLEALWGRWSDGTRL